MLQEKMGVPMFTFVGMINLSSYGGLFNKQIMKSDRDFRITIL